MNKKLKDIANNIYNLEQKCQQNINVKENMEEMEKIILSLSLNDLLKINEYLEKKLTK